MASWSIYGGQGAYFSAMLATFSICTSIRDHHDTKKCVYIIHAYAHIQCINDNYGTVQMGIQSVLRRL